MILKSLMQKPVLMIGIILFGLFIHQVSKKEKWGIFHNDKLISYPCRAALVKIDKHIPGNWKTECEGNNLAVIIQEDTPADDQNIQLIMYRQLANHMTYLAKVSQADLLEKVMFVRFQLKHKLMTVNAVTEGQYIVKLATLEDPELIRSHFKSTVQVQEVRK